MGIYVNFLFEAVPYPVVVFSVLKVRFRLAKKYEATKALFLAKGVNM